MGYILNHRQLQKVNITIRQENEETTLQGKLGIPLAKQNAKMHI